MPSNWSNRTLWTGDNLDIMRGMNSETVDLIYLDPPFNSNRDYAAPIGSEAAGAAFKDTWALSDVDEAWHGEIADRDPTDKPTFNVQYVPVSPGTMKRWKGRKQQAVIEGGVRYAESTAAETRNPCLTGGKSPSSIRMPRSA